jgi:hypothetical protein
MNEQQRREGQRVRVDHPLQVDEARSEPGLHLRQDDHHDRDVEQQHERADADGEQRAPFASHGDLLQEFNKC